MVAILHFSSAENPLARHTMPRQDQLCGRLLQQSTAFKP